MKTLQQIDGLDSMINEVIHADCLEVMKQIPDKSIDLVLTDPPYGINIAKDGFVVGKQNSACKAKRRNYGISDWDKKIPEKEYFEEMFRISKNQIIFGANYFTECLPSSSCWLVWDKNNQSSPFADCELAYTSFKKGVKLFKYTWNGMIQEDMKHKEIRHHPTQKPVALMEWCLENYSKRGDLIFDGFGGSGTTARACKDMNRDFIICEKELKYCEIAEKRLLQEVLF